jgi:hypothetical protein
LPVQNPDKYRESLLYGNKKDLNNGFSKQEIWSRDYSNLFTGQIGVPIMVESLGVLENMHLWGSFYFFNETKMLLNTFF